MTPYKTVRFAVGEIPQGLLRRHEIREGVRAELRVLSGELTYVDETSRVTLGVGDTQALSAGVPHWLEDAADAAIEIRFYRLGENSGV